jgi:penicillin-binding protein 2B
MKKIDQNQEELSSQHKSYRKSHIPFRLNLLFFVIFGLFITLIVQLGYLQIVNTDAMEQEIKASSVIKIQGSTPRGIIYDAAGKPLVSNRANTAITFTRQMEMTAADLLNISQKLNDLISIEVDENLTERDLKDYWLADEEHLKEAQERIVDDENPENLSEYDLILSKVSSEEIQFSQEQLVEATIFKRLNSAQQLRTVFVKNQDVTDEEVALVAERIQDLPGISTGMDWEREVVTTNDGLKNIIGRVSEGLRSENADEYLEKGYSLDDRVGTSFLEKQYEDVLQGIRSQQEITLSNEGRIQKQEEVFSGEKGDNLVLSIDTEFQAKMDKILEDVYRGLMNSNAAKYSPGVYAVAMNPQTGSILAMSGFYHDIEEDKLYDDTIGVYQHAFEPGSVIKAATLTAGWQNGVLNGNEVLYDQPIYLEGANPKGSVYNRNGQNNRNISAVQSLEFSSNSYMMQVALRILGINYQGNKIFMPSVTTQEEAYGKLRAALGSYGLGVSTGIDLPNEATGYQPEVSSLSDAANQAGLILDLSFGQYDTYTTMQLGQYVSTIANGGKRMEPHIVEGIYANDEYGNLGELKEKIEPKVLSEVDLPEEDMSLIQEGFYKVIHGTDGLTTARSLSNTKMDIAGKSGTAEKIVFNSNGEQIEVVNLNMVAYGPTENPEIAVAVVVPQILTTETNFPNYAITRQIMDAYYDLYLK